jgi:hypothetical protein
MSNHITIELCAEDRQRIDELIAFAGLIASEMKSRKESAGMISPQSDNRDTWEHPIDAVAPHGEPVADPEPAEKVYKITKDDIMAKVQSLAAPNNPKREQAKAIVKSYGAKVSDIPEDKYTEVMDKLVELEG